MKLANDELHDNQAEKTATHAPSQKFDSKSELWPFIMSV